MSAYAALVYIPVLLTMTVACSQRGSHAVASRLARGPIVEPRSDAYDADAWARKMAARDQVLAEHIAAIKADLLEKSHFDFYPPEDEIFPARINPRDWRAMDREMIKVRLRDILVRTEKRRAYHDDHDLARDARRTRIILDYFARYDASKAVAK